MKKIIMFAATLAVMITLFSACKTQKNFSKQPDVPLVYVVDTQNTSTEVLEAILAEEKKGNKKKVKNNWYPNLSGYPLPEKITEESEKNVTYIFNIDLTILPEEEQPVYAPTLPENEYHLGASLPAIPAAQMWLPFLIVLAIGLFVGYLLRGGRQSTTTSQNAPYATEAAAIIAAFGSAGGTLTYNPGATSAPNLGGTGIFAIRVNGKNEEVKKDAKVEPEKKD